MSRALVVEEVGPQALVVDRGRPGWAHIGVPTGGRARRSRARPRPAPRGQRPGRGGLEILLGGLALRATAATTVALTGPPAACVPRGPARSAWRRRTSPCTSPPTTSSSCPRRDLGAARLPGGRRRCRGRRGAGQPQRGHALGARPGAAGGRARLPVGAATTVPAVGTGAIGVSTGPTPPSSPCTWARGPTGSPTRPGACARAPGRWPDRRPGRGAPRGPGPGAGGHRVGEELRSEGLVGGAVQVPPDGRPVVFLADHPTTGGYPVVGVVDPAELAAFAQLRPGSTVRFSPVAPPLP